MRQSGEGVSSTHGVSSTGEGVSSTDGEVRASAALMEWRGRQQH